LPASAANTTEASLEVHFNSAAPLISGAGGAGTTVLETTLDTRDSTAGFDAAGGSTRAASVASSVGDASSASKWTSQVNELRESEVQRTESVI